MITATAPASVQSKTQVLDAQRFMMNYWQRLIEFGMPIHEANKVAKAVAKYKFSKTLKEKRRSTKARELVPTYWRKLIEAGVPIDDAKVLAEAIALYDTLKLSPNPGQQTLIRQYCRFLCRVELWRSSLLKSAS
jgi:hypothetical protein